MWEERMLQPRHPLELRGQRILASRPNRTYPAGRECAADGCDTRLSIYNGFRFCWQHERVHTLARWQEDAERSLAKGALKWA